MTQLEFDFNEGQQTNTYTFTISRTYETVVEIEASDKEEALKQLYSMDIYSIELEQCCVVEESVFDELGNQVEY